MITKTQGVQQTRGGRAWRFFDRFEDGRYGAGENHQVFLFEAPGDAAPVPEPGTIALVGTGALVAAIRRRRQRRAAQ